MSHTWFTFDSSLLPESKNNIVKEIKPEIMSSLKDFNFINSVQIKVNDNLVVDDKKSGTLINSERKENCDLHKEYFSFYDKFMNVSNNKYKNEQKVNFDKKMDELKEKKKR